MVRTFLDRPLEPDAVDRILRTAHRAPSAGFTQGYAFLVFEGRETSAFWEALGRVMHDYDARRAALCALGPRLEW